MYRFLHIVADRYKSHRYSILRFLQHLIIVENHYLGEVIKKNQFDTFYHEHPRTYSLQSFYKIAENLGFWPYISASVEERSKRMRPLMEDVLEANYQGHPPLNI